MLHLQVLYDCYPQMASHCFDGILLPIHILLCLLYQFLWKQTILFRHLQLSFYISKSYMPDHKLFPSPTHLLFVLLYSMFYVSTKWGMSHYFTVSYILIADIKKKAVVMTYYLAFFFKIKCIYHNNFFTK
jgi:hypothetical protein